MIAINEEKFREIIAEINVTKKVPWQAVEDLIGKNNENFITFSEVLYFRGLAWGVRPGGDIEILARNAKAAEKYALGWLA